MNQQELEQMAADLLGQIATVNLTGSASIEAMAEAEGVHCPDSYAVALSEHIRDSQVPFDSQRERMKALAQVGAGLAGDRASADELARHFSVLEALFHRFARAAHEVSAKDPIRGSGPAVAYLGAAMKAQRAALATLSALKVLRDGNQAAPLTTSAPAPAAGPVVEAGAVEVGRAK